MTIKRNLKRIESNESSKTERQVQNEKDAETSVVKEFF